MALQTNCSFNDDTKSWDIAIHGEVDVANAQELRHLLTQSYEKTAADMYLDVSGLCYIDSTGLGVLIGVFGRMQEQNHRIFIENPRENIEKLLRITSLNRIFCQME